MSRLGGIRETGVNLAALLSLVAALGGPVAWGGGGGGTEVGNGGHVVILPDDTVVLADPYVLRSDSRNIGELNPAILGELSLAGQFLARLGAVISDPRPVDFPRPPRDVRPHYLSRAGQALFMDEEVFARKVEYHFVSALDECRAIRDLPSGLKAELAACTEGVVTWIRKDLFRRMSVREQAKLILHERLHAAPAAFPHEFIADVTTAVELLFSLRQAQAKGERPVLTPEQVSLIELLMKRIEQMGLAKGRPEPSFYFLDHFVVTPDGGGLVHRQAKIEQGAYIGVGSLLGSGAVVAAEAEVLFSVCYLASCALENGVRLADAAIEPGYGDDYLINPLSLVTGPGARLAGSRVSGVDGINLGRESLVRLGDGSSIELSSLSGIQGLTLERGAALSEVMLGLGSDFRRPNELLLRSGASLRRMFAPLLFQGDKANVLALTVSEGASMDFDRQPVCPLGGFLILNDSLEVRTRAELAARCREPGRQ